MVCLTEYPSFLLASCCKVDVVNGAAGVLELSFSSISSRMKLPCLIEDSMALASFSLAIFFNFSLYLG
jgi:hypothetical protein